MFCVDGLARFRKSINITFPKSNILRCIIHQTHLSTRYVSHKDIKSLMADQKNFYQAINWGKSLSALLEFKKMAADLCSHHRTVFDFQKNLPKCSLICPPK